MDGVGAGDGVWGEGVLGAKRVLDPTKERSRLWIHVMVAFRNEPFLDYQSYIRVDILLSLSRQFQTEELGLAKQNS